MEANAGESFHVQISAALASISCYIRNWPIKEVVPNLAEVSFPDPLNVVQTIGRIIKLSTSLSNGGREVALMSRRSCERHPFLIGLRFSSQ